MQTALGHLKLFGGVVICYRSVNLSTRALGFFCSPSFGQPEPEAGNVSKRAEDAFEPVHFVPFPHQVPRRVTRFPGSTPHHQTLLLARCVGARKDAHLRTGHGGADVPCPP